MTLFQLAVVPGILLGIFLSAAGFFLARYGLRKLRTLAAERRYWELPPDLMIHQSQVIADVIADASPYLRNDLREELIAAHGEYMDYLNKEKKPR